VLYFQLQQSCDSVKRWQLSSRSMDFSLKTEVTNRFPRAVAPGKTQSARQRFPGSPGQWGLLASSMVYSSIHGMKTIICEFDFGLEPCGGSPLAFDHHKATVQGIDLKTSTGVFSSQIYSEPPLPDV
jgi:hypothetical protein